VVLIPYGAPEGVTQEAAAVCAAYSNAKQGEAFAVSVRTAKGLETVTVTRGLRERYARYQI
jgi:predicted ribosome quality control (RQC) complex YloA/Tae2 family protein